MIQGELEKPWGEKTLSVGSTKAGKHKLDLVSRNVAAVDAHEMMDHRPTSKKGRCPPNDAPRFAPESRSFVA